MNSCELITFISALACNISKCYTKDELILFSTIFMQLGDTLATIVAREDFCESLKEKQCNTDNDC